MMTLDFSPAEEREVQERAQRDGMSLTDYARRQLLTDAIVPLAPDEPEWKTRLRVSQEAVHQAFVESGLSEEEIAADIEAEIKAYRAERKTYNQVKIPTL